MMNLLKHHKSVIEWFVSEAVSGQWDRNRIRKELSVLGTSQMDIYNGKLCPYKISVKLEQQVQEVIYSEKSYYEWLFSEGRTYREVTICDGSTWTLLKGKKDGFYAHIHPSRQSELCFRAKANTLRTVIGILINMKQNQSPALSISAINYIRTEYFRLSPIRRMEDSQAILNLLKTFDFLM